MGEPASPRRGSEPKSIYGDFDPLSAYPSPKRSLLAKRLTPPRARDPRVAQVAVALSASGRRIEIVRADGFEAHDQRPLVRISVLIVAERNGRRESGSAGLGGRYLYGKLFAAEGRSSTWRSLGAGEPRRGPRARGRNGCGARPGLARRAAARSGRPWPRGRLQPQGHVGLLRRSANASPRPA